MVRISRALVKAKKEAGKLPVEVLKEQIIQYINQDSRLKVEYFDIVDNRYLKPVRNWTEKSRKIGCIAVKIGSIRLIDNMKFYS